MPNVGCEMHWMHLTVSGICDKSFCLQKMNNTMLFLTGCFQWHDSFFWRPDRV